MVTVLSKQKQRAARGKGPASNTNKTQLLNPLEFPIALAHPQRLTDVASWHEHIPFAFALVAMGRPRVIVELGTHKGDSYCAFCQAVDVLGLSTKCYAVDTWEGDSHSGFYGPEVLTFELARPCLRTSHHGRPSVLVVKQLRENHLANGATGNLLGAATVGRYKNGLPVRRHLGSAILMM